MEQIKKFLRDKGFALALLACLVAAGAAGVWAVRAVRDELKQDYESLTQPGASSAPQQAPNDLKVEEDELWQDVTDGVDQVSYVLCSCFVCILTGCLAAGSGGACCAGSSAGGCAAAAGKHTGAQSQSRHSSGQLFGLEFSHECFSFPAKKYSALKQKGTGKKS